MLMKSPYETTYGQMINTAKLQKDLVKYIGYTRNNNLNYEYHNTDGTNLVFILGVDADEQELPIWEHPFLFNDINNKPTVAVDLRKFVKKVNEQPMTIEEVIKDSGSVQFLILNALLTTDYRDGNFGYFRTFNKPVATSFSYVMSHMVNSIVGLNPVEKVHVEIVLAHYINMLLTDSSEKEDMVHQIVARISNMKLSVPVNNKSIEAVMLKIEHNVSDFDGLMENIKTVLPEEKRDLIDVNSFINVISNIWYGPGNAETVVMSVEHLPTWMTLAYINVADKSFKRTRLATMLDKHSRQLDAKQFEKDMLNYIKKRTMTSL